MLRNIPNMSSFALEMIEVQNDNFGKDLEALHTVLKEIIIKNNIRAKDVAELKVINDIKKLVHTRLGLNVRFITNSIIAAVMPFYPGPNHVFMHKMFKGDLMVPDQKAFIKKNEGKKGSVDLKKAKVSGTFSEYEVKMYMNYIDLFKELKASPAEATAILLHELGHAFYSCSYSDRIDTTNQILSDIATNLTGKKDLTTEIVYKEITKLNPNVTEAYIDEIVNGNRVIAGPKLAKVIFEGFHHQLKDETYDRTSFEAMADNFAGRFGYGRPLITGLEKLGHLYQSPDYYTSMRMSMYWGQIILLTVLTIAVIGLVGFTIPAVIISSLIITFFIYAWGEANKDYTYDDTKFRFNRVKQDMINQLKPLLEKDDGASKAQIKQLLDNIEDAQRAMDEVKPFSLLFSTFSNFVFPSNRKARQSVKEQQLIESLAANDLFIKAASLKTLA